MTIEIIVALIIGLAIGLGVRAMEVAGADMIVKEEESKAKIWENQADLYKILSHQTEKDIVVLKEQLANSEKRIGGLTEIIQVQICSKNKPTKCPTGTPRNPNPKKTSGS
jgi:hypothetical protein